MKTIPALAIGCLRLTIAVGCAGLVALYYGHHSETESDIYGVLYFDWQFAEATAQRVDDAGVLLCGVAAAWVLAAGLLASYRSDAADLSRGQSPARRRSQWAIAALDGIALLWIAGWLAAIAVAHQIRGGPYTEWAMAEHAVRYAAPLAVLIVGPLGTLLWRSTAAATAAWILLRLAAAATFVAHGYKAIEGYGPFVDLILLTDLRWAGSGVQQPTVETVLAVIGWIDLTVALLVLSPWWRFAAMYMAVWGAVTASSRITGLSLEVWPETLIRAANCGVPLALVWWNRRAATIKNDAPSEETITREDRS